MTEFDESVKRLRFQSKFMKCFDIDLVNYHLEFIFCARL